MPDLPITPPIVTPSAQTSGRITASHSGSDEPTETGIPSGTSSSFAATLTSLTDKKSTSFAKDEQFVDGAVPLAEYATLPLITPETPDLSDSDEVSATPIDSSALLSLLQADVSFAQASAVPAITPASTVVSMPKPSMSAASAVPPAPTFPLNQGSIPKTTLTALPSGLAIDPAGENHSPISKLAVQAATSAESIQEAPVNSASSQAQETFSTVMERITNHSSAGFAYSQAAGTSALPPTLELPVEIRQGQPGWRDEVGQKLTWMISNNRQQADLILTPPQLGRIEVTLSLDGNQASASFASPHAAVREALENSMTRLREILADAGVTLGQTHVGSESRRESNPLNPKNEGLAIMRQDNAHYVAALAPPGSGFASRGFRAHGMVDVFV
ncbi:MAG: flagellar hook-length control protein FliK [Rugosibacter sp.]|nr:flagellar hook-length control protein FliK [Rugosibacter sp.]